MTRRHVSFACEGCELAATLDPAPGATGLLIVSGGNELRSGPFASHAALAARIAAAGFPVLRFDRRGVGDSEGANRGFRSSGPDLAAALAAFRRECPALAQVVGFGNCDAAAALMLGRGAGFAALVLANPWTFDEATPLADTASAASAPAMTPQLLRAHYVRRLTDPRALLRVLTGKVALGGLLASLRGAARKPAPPSTLAQEIAAGLAAFPGPARLLVAEGDRTGQAFLTHWDRADPRLSRRAGANHAFSGEADQNWLLDEILGVLNATRGA